MARILERLVDAYWATDAGLVEINPLVATPDGAVIALDAKMVVDDNALFRHPGSPLTAKTRTKMKRWRERWVFPMYRSKAT